MVGSNQYRKRSMGLLAVVLWVACLSACQPDTHLAPTPTPTPRLAVTMAPLHTPASIPDYLSLGDATLLANDFAATEIAYQKAQQTTTDYGSVYGRLALLYALQPQRWRESLAMGQKAVDLARDDAEAWAYFSLTHALNGHTEQALRTAQHAQELDKQLSIVNLALAQAYLSQYDVDTALGYVEPILAQEPENVLALLVQAQCYLKRKSLDPALIAAEKAVILAPDFVPARLILAQAHQAAWEYPEAERELAYALETTPSAIPAHIAWLRFAAEQGQIDEAEATLALLERYGAGVPQILNVAGWLALQQHAYALALDKFQAVLDLDPDFAPAYLGLGAAHYGQRGCAAALVAYTQAAKRWPYAAESHLGQARSYECLGNADKARDHYLRSVTFPWDSLATLVSVADYAARQDDTAGRLALQHTILMHKPDNVAYYVELGQRYLAASDIEAAHGNFRQVLALDPDNVTAWIGLGRIYHSYALYENARSLFQKALALEPDAPQAGVGLGMAYTRLGQYEQAIAAMEPTLPQVQDWPEAYLHLARAYRVQKQYAEAGAAMGRFVQQQPDALLAPMLHVTAQSLASKRYWIQQENTAPTLQAIMTATLSKSTVPWAITAIEVVKQEDKVRVLDVAMTFAVSDANSAALHRKVMVASACSAAVVPRILPPVDGGLQLTVHDTDGNALFEVQVPTALAQDIADGLVQNYAALRQHVTWRDLRYPAIVNSQSPVVALDTPSDTDQPPPELLALLGDTAPLPYATQVGGPYHDTLTARGEPSATSAHVLGRALSRLRGSWQPSYSAAAGAGAVQEHLSARVSPDLAAQIAPALRDANYIFFQNRTDHRGLLVWQTTWDTLDAARYFVMAYRLAWMSHPDYQVCQRELHGGQRALRWENTTGDVARFIHVDQQEATVWVIFAQEQADVDTVLALLATH